MDDSAAGGSVQPPPGMPLAVKPPPGISASKAARAQFREGDDIEWEGPSEDQAPGPKWPEVHRHHNAYQETATRVPYKQDLSATPKMPFGYTFDPQLQTEEGAPKAAEEEKEGKKKRKKQARVQVKKNKKMKFQREENLNEYNIWYGKYLNWDKDFTREKPETRCNLKMDAGETRATEKAYCCIWFARGCCTNGNECIYQHRTPNLNDVQHVDMTHDCFGRDRHQNMRDDMGGVGCFNQDCRTLYVGNVGSLGGLKKVDPRTRWNHSLEKMPGFAKAVECLARHFGEWGAIEEISYKPKFGCAFVRYVSRLNAEFAKIAMSDQSLDNPNVTVNIRWAYDDPNPKAIERNKEEMVDRLHKAIHDKGYNLAQSDVQYKLPNGYSHPTGERDGANYNVDYDHYGYNMVTGAYDPAYNKTTPAEAHGADADQFATNAAKAARAALARSKRYSEQQQQAAPDGVEAAGAAAAAEAGMVGGVNQQAGAEGMVGAEGYDWNAYYQYCYGQGYTGHEGYQEAYQEGYQEGQTGAASSAAQADYYAQYGAQMHQAAANAWAQTAEAEASAGPRSKEEQEQAEVLKKEEQAAQQQADAMNAFSSLLDRIDAGSAK